MVRNPLYYSFLEIGMNKLQFVILLMLASNPQAQSQPSNKEVLFECPRYYSEKNVVMRQTPEGWNGLVNVAGNKLIIHTAGVLIGNQEDLRGYLPGEKQNVAQMSYEHEFRDIDVFDKSMDRWAYCGYGQGGYLQLMKRLPAKTKSCTTLHTENGEGTHDIRFFCR